MYLVELLILILFSPLCHATNVPSDGRMRKYDWCDEIIWKIGNFFLAKKEAEQIQMVEKEFLNVLETLIQRKMADEEKTQVQLPASAPILPQPALNSKAILSPPAKNSDQIKETEKMNQQVNEAVVLAHSIRGKNKQTFSKMHCSNFFY